MLIYPGAFKDLAGNANIDIMGRTKYDFVSGDCVGAPSDDFDNTGEATCLGNGGSVYVAPTCTDADGVQVPYIELGEPNNQPKCQGTAYVRLTETADTTPPSLLSEVIDYGLGTLTLTFSETIDVKPPESLCSPTNVIGGAQLACTGLTGNSYTAAKCMGGGAAADPYSADADGTLCTTDASPGVYTGASCTNGGDVSSKAACEGTATGNTFAAGTMDLTRVRIDNTSNPGDSGAYHLQDMSIKNSVHTDISIGSRLNLAQTDETTVVLIFSESERTALIGYSGTKGGDSPYPNISKTFVDENSSLILDVLQGAFKDLSANLVQQKLDIVMEEIPDNKGPTFETRAPHLLDLNDGTLVIKSHKTLNIDPYESAFVPIDLRKVFLSGSGTDLDILLAGATVISTADSLDLTLRLTEPQRVSAVFLSNTPGGGGTFSTGDGSPAFLALLRGAFMDTARNLNNDSYSLIITETADTKRPQVTGVALDLNDGRLRITADETLDATPESPYVVELASLVVANVNRNAPFGLRDLVTCSDANFDGDEDGCTGLTGYTHVAAAGSDCSVDDNGTHDSDKPACTGISGNVYTASRCSNNPTHNANQGSCEAGSGVYFAPTCATCSDNGDASSELQCTGLTGNTYVAAKCVGGGAAADPYGADADGTLCTTNASPGVYTGASCTNGGDANSQAACEGIATGNTFAAAGGDATNIASCEGTATGHTFTPAHGNLCRDWFGDNTGNAGSFVLCQGPGATGNTASIRPFAYKDAAFVLTGATVEQADGLTITIQLTEEQRSSAVRISGTPGGDSANAQLSVQRGALRDMSNNSVVEILNIVIAETADTTKPVVEAASIQFSTGLLTLNMSEIVDCSTVADNIDLNKVILIDHFLNPSLFQLGLNGATVLHSEDTQRVIIRLTEHQRTDAILKSGVKGGDSFALYIQVLDGAFKDVAGNPNVEVTDLLVAEQADTVEPEFYQGVLDYNTGTGVLTLTSTEFLDLALGSSGAAKTGNTFTPADISHCSDGTDGDDDLTRCTGLTGNTLHASSCTNPTYNTNGFGCTQAGAIFTAAVCRDASGQDTGANADNQVACEGTSNGATFQAAHPNLCTNNGDTSSRVACEELSLGAVNVSNIYLANADSGYDVSLHGSSVSSVAFSSRSHDLVVTLTEQQRVDAIAISGTPGGDGNALFAHVLADIVAGYGTRGNRLNTSVTLTEIPDTTRPSLLSAAINLGTGVVIVTGSEFIDATPSTHVDPSLMTLVQDTEIVTHAVNLAGATVTAVDGYGVTLQLSEDQRVAALGISATPGGDGVPMRMDCQAGAVRDVSTNPSVVSNDLFVAETADTIPPTIVSAAFDFNNRMLVVECSETISVVETFAKVGTAPPSLVDQTLLVLANQAGVHNNADTHIAVSGATLINVIDKTSFTLQLTEAQKVTLQLFSATAGGDGTGHVFTPSNCSNNVAYDSLQAQCEADADPSVGVFTPSRCDSSAGAPVSTDGTGSSASISACTGASVLDVLQAAFKDVANNPVNAVAGFPVTETSDTTAPTVVSATVDYGFSTLTVGLDEFVSTKNNNNDATDTTVYVDLADFIFRDVHTMYHKYDDITTRYAGQNFYPNEKVPMLDATVRVDASHRTSSITFDLSEATRVALVQMSGVPGGDRSPIMPYGSVATHVCMDGSVISSNGCGDPVQVEGAPDTQTLVHYYYDPGAVILDVIIGGLRDMASNLNAEITECRERCTNDQAAFCALDSCPAPEARGVVVIEIPDTVKPTISTVVVDFGLAEVRIRASETMDASPPSDLHLDGLFLANVAGGQDVPLVGSTVSSQISQTLTIGLSEATRIAAMTIAGTPGGDGSKITFTVATNNSVQDMSANFMLATAIEGAALTELPDTIGPRLINSLLYLSNGTMVLSAYETIDVNPASDLRIDRMYLRGSASHLPAGSAGYTGESGQSISLAGATVLSEV